MTHKQDTTSKPEAEAPKHAAQDKISTRSEKDALGDSSLDDVSGGGWPYLLNGSSASFM
ncbi:hypothetical protein [Bradyrhizobium niftali]|uniref:hypothetical protein n=1 Tax=Bradyrhizobium niftali TaxID=2560055 RepID=UPI0014322EE7|nr:hypothetical protein [Bradyrhizobium niftali]